MKDRIENFLTAEERLVIESKVREAEASTSGEIVVVAVGQSSAYPSAAMVSGGAFALLSGVAVMLLLQSDNMWLFLALYAVFFVVAHALVSRFPDVKRPFVSRREIAEEVEEAAIRVFYHRRVHETRDRTGILIYISLFEHTVRVLADTGINARVGQQTWQGVVDTIIKGIRNGQQGESICSAVEECGRLLGDYFPRRPDDRNELDDAMIVG
jgi:putative membrane protein